MPPRSTVRAGTRAKERAPVPAPPTAVLARTAARERAGSRCPRRIAKPKAARSPSNVPAGRWRRSVGRRDALARPELEIAFANDLFFNQVDQEGAPFADHAVEGQQVPNVEGPADVAAFARRRPLRRIEIPEARRTNPAVDAQLAEGRRGAHDLDGLQRSHGLDLATPLAHQTKARWTAAEISLSLVGFIGRKPGEVGDVELREQIVRGDRPLAGGAGLVELAAAFGRVVGVKAQRR